MLAFVSCTVRNLPSFYRFSGNPAGSHFSAAFTGTRSSDARRVNFVFVTPFTKKRGDLAIHNKSTHHEINDNGDTPRLGIPVIGVPQLTPHPSSKSPQFLLKSSRGGARTRRKKKRWKESKVPYNFAIIMGRLLGVAHRVKPPSHRWLTTFRDRMKIQPPVAFDVRLSVSSHPCVIVEDL